MNQLKMLEPTMPHLVQEARKGNIWTWNDMGYSGELSEQHKQHIADFEEHNAEYGSKVYAVLDNYSRIEGEAVHMISYLFTSDEGFDISPYDEITFYAIADVVNESWGFHEMGSVLIQGGPTGGPRRVG